MAALFDVGVNMWEHGGEPRASRNDAEAEEKVRDECARDGFLSVRVTMPGCGGNAE